MRRTSGSLGDRSASRSSTTTAGGGTRRSATSRRSITSSRRRSCPSGPLAWHFPHPDWCSIPTACPQPPRPGARIGDLAEFVSRYPHASRPQQRPHCGSQCGSGGNGCPRGVGTSYALMFPASPMRCWLGREPRALRRAEATPLGFREAEAVSASRASHGAAELGEALRQGSRQTHAQCPHPRCPAPTRSRR